MEHSNKKDIVAIVNSIYEESHPRDSDLISEAGGNEFFLIEGDSLLLDILKAPYRRIDWNYSGQFLHLLAAIEQFLNQILLAGGKFAIIFFDCHGLLWEPSIQCFRHLLIQHLIYKTELDVHCLPSWMPDVDPRFTQEFMQSLPAFVALSDAEYATNTTMVLRLRTFFAFCKQRLNTCFISSMRLRSGRLFGYICPPSHRGKPSVDFPILDELEMAPKKSEWSEQSDLSWLNSITSLACIGVLNASDDNHTPQFFELCKVMLIHAALISELPLEQRALNVKILQGAEVVEKFIGSYFRILNAILERYDFGQAVSVDIFDGRLFYSLLVFFANNENLEPKDVLDEASYAVVAKLWTQIAGPGSPVIPRIDFIKGECVPTAPPAANAQMIRCHSIVKSIVLPNPIGAEGRELRAPKQITEFSEKHHWHSDKPLDAFTTLAKRRDEAQGNDEKENRNAQKFYAFVTKYALSLEGSKLYQGTPLTLGSKITVKEEKVAAKPKKPFVKKGTQSLQARKEAIIQQNARNKEKKKREEWSLTTKVIVTSLWKTGRRKEAVARLQSELKNSCPSDVNLEIRLLLLKIYMKYLDDLRTAGKEDDWKIQCNKSDVFRLVHKIIDKHGSNEDNTSPLTDAIKASLVKALVSLRFYDSAVLAAEELNIKTPKVGKDGESSIRFQLEIMGHLLKRKSSLGFDPRVGFKPDAWQKELIDIVDESGSALVVAPTSAGKTFISYYAMKRVLEATEDGIVVYISPTKALVNQVSAEIYARFGSCQEQLKNGTSIFGTFTRDYRHKPLNCRILVCVPQCFEILLLSPHHAEWAKKIKYAIFDEVHSIAEVGSGEVWEHLFSLISCPFLALSATVQDTNKLRNWLQIKLDQQSVDVKITDDYNVIFHPQEEKKQEVHLIEYKHRYSDLSRFIYTPQSKLTRVHPCSLLSAAIIRSKGFPKEINLEPCDLVQLYDAMAHRAHKLPELAKEQVNALHYQKNEDFAKSRQITKLQAIAWQEKLIQMVVTLAQEKHIEWLDKVFALLGKPTSSSIVWEDVFSMLAHLKQKKLLPAIVFSFDRGLCESLAKKTVYEVRKQGRKMFVKLPEPTPAPAKGHRAVANSNIKRPSPDAQRQGERSMDLSKVRAAKVSFVDPVALTKVEVDTSMLTEEEQVMTSLGVGIHHAGRSTKYKQMVEFLFRSKAIQVVFATSTLALGINMPCKTVVFAKDSMYLNALSFRQMAGRAGRRGYEKRGSVVFMEVNERKMRRLFNSDLPILEANFPLSVTLVLRAFLLYKDEPTALSALKIKKLFSDPLSDTVDDRKLQSYFRFSMEYLMTESLLSPDGKTIGLAGIAAHLWWSEPANLLLVSLIQRSILHNICLDKNLTPDQKKKQLLITLSTVFTPHEIHPSMMKHIKKNKTASKIILEKPPKAVIDAIMDHNARILQTFLTTRRAIQRSEAREVKLPLSKIKHQVKGDQILSNALHQHLNASRVVTQLRDPFNVLSGASDEITSVKEICACIPDVDEGMLPVFRYSPDVSLNRYLLDYYEHKQLDLLEEANWLNSGDSYELTNSFRLVLRAIAAILADITRDSDPLRRYIYNLAAEYGLRLRKEHEKRALIPKK